MATETEHQAKDHVLDTQLSNKFTNHGVQPLWTAIQAMVQRHSPE
jgi:hypothetical protein